VDAALYMSLYIAITYDMQPTTTKIFFLIVFIFCEFINRNNLWICDPLIKNILKYFFLYNFLIIKKIVEEGLKLGMVHLT
jgi:uncharacterized membrane protein (DUF441 family)